MAEKDLSIGNGPTLRPVSASGGRHLVAGDTILGRYAVVRELGEGGMGIVYQCLDTVGGVEVAVKGLPPEVSRNADEMEDIRANYQIVRKLRHPNIAGVATLEKDAAGGDYYLVMDLAAGVTLKRWARRHPDAGLDAKLAILRQVAAALDYAHAEKVIHRDVKPENVMVDDAGRVKVLDFGLAAQIRSSQSRTSNTVTSKGGTPGYKSPEQWRGKPQREPADVYSFGAMAYWMFAGALPFDGDDPVVLGHAVLTEPVGPITGIPAHMNAALVKALAKDPEDRFPTCTAFVDALEGKVGSRVPRDRTGGPRSSAAVKGLLVAALLAALAGGGYYGWTKYDKGVKARAAQQAEERARLEKAGNASAKPETTTELTLTEQEARQKEVARLAELRVDIGIKCEDAKEKMGRLAAYRGEPDGFKVHINNADVNWKIIEAVERSPATVLEAEKSLKSVTEAENVIAKELHWLSTNKKARDRAKATEAEIAREIDPELKRFKADDYARDVFAAGDCLRKEGNAALANGDFPLAKEKLDSAKAKLSEAAANARRFCIDTHLNTAKKWIDASRWPQCVEECEIVLGWDAANAEAKELKNDAESHLVPTMQVVAKINGHEIFGAKVEAGEESFTTPFVWKLKEGSRCGPYAVSYENGGRHFHGILDAVTVDWHGSRSISVELEEHVKPHARVSAIDSAVDRNESSSSTNRPTFVPYAGQTREYIVKAGDSLGKIARENGIRIRALKELNGLTKDTVRMGMRLKIPVGRQTVTTVGRTEEVKEQKTVDTKTITLPGGSGAGTQFSFNGPPPSLTVMPETEKKVVREKEAVRVLRDEQVPAGEPFAENVSTGLGAWVDPEYPQFKYFRVRVASRAEKPLPVVSKDMLFMLDASGSIGNDRLKSCRTAVAEALRRLNTGDRFNIIAFRDKFTYAFPEAAWKEVTDGTLRQADKWLGGLTAHGQTDLFHTLRSVLTLPRDPSRPVVALVVTDGDATSGLTRNAEIISRFSEQNGGLISVFMYGVKAEANAYLMDMLTRGNRGGWARHEGLRWRAADGIPALMKKFERPVLSDVSVTFASSSRAEVYPKLVANLCEDEPIEIYGVCPADQKELVFQMRGLNGSTVFENLFRISFATAENLDESVRREWATRHIYALIKAYSANPKEETLRDMRLFAEHYKIQIPFENEVR